MLPLGFALVEYSPAIFARCILCAYHSTLHNIGAAAWKLPMTQCAELCFFRRNKPAGGIVYRHVVYFYPHTYFKEPPNLPSLPTSTTLYDVLACVN